MATTVDTSELWRTALEHAELGLVPRDWSGGSSLHLVVPPGRARKPLTLASAPRRNKRRQAIALLLIPALFGSGLYDDVLTRLCPVPSASVQWMLPAPARAS
ncbi:MAG: hypothetical protein ABI743_13660 [bacterium]